MIGDRRFRVVGVVETAPSRACSARGAERAREVFVPFTHRLQLATATR